MNFSKKIAVIIVAAGRGSRASDKSNSLPKQYRNICEVPVLTRTIEQFLKLDIIDIIIPVIHKDDKKNFADLHLSDKRITPPVFGGKTRQISVFAGLKQLEKLNPDYVLIHDGARPFVDENVIMGVINALKMAKAAIPATPVIDSIKRSTDGRIIGGSEDKNQLYAAQTPQAFHYRDIFEAHKKLAPLSEDYTDDAAIAQWANIEVVLSKGNAENFKITTASDFRHAERFLGGKKMETRVGNGYDIHQFEKGNGVILGGIKIPHSAKLKGHSDADTALHVLTDAILGALADGDIGVHFPPSEKKWKGAPSSTFLKFAIERLKKRSGRIVNLDLTIICETPKIAPHTMAMRTSIAKICNIKLERISIKATTSEKMGFIGRGEGIATLANATIELPRGE